MERSENNYQNLVKAFEQFRLPVFDMTLDNFLNTETIDVFRFGRPPVAIDIITNLKGLDFNEAWERIQRREFGKVEINYLHFKDLITAKQASARPKDINDIENLRNNNSNE